MYLIRGSVGLKTKKGDTYEYTLVGIHMNIPWYIKHANDLIISICENECV